MMYRIQFRRTNGKQGFTHIPADNGDEAQARFEALAASEAPNGYRIPFEAKPTKVTLYLGPSTKQILAQRYGFIMGGIKGAQSQFNSLRNSSNFFRDADAVVSNRAGKAIALVNMQFSKLQRDIADVFKLAGLKIK